MVSPMWQNLISERQNVEGNRFCHLPSTLKDCRGFYVGPSEMPFITEQQFVVSLVKPYLYLLLLLSCLIFLSHSRLSRWGYPLPNTVLAYKLTSGSVSKETCLWQYARPVWLITTCLSSLLMSPVNLIHCILATLASFFSEIFLPPLLLFPYFFTGFLLLLTYALAQIWSPQRGFVCPHCLKKNPPPIPALFISHFIF